MSEKATNPQLSGEKTKHLSSDWAKSLKWKKLFTRNLFCQKNNFSFADDVIDFFLCERKSQVASTTLLIYEESQISSDFWRQCFKSFTNLHQNSSIKILLWQRQNWIWICPVAENVSFIRCKYLKQARFDNQEHFKSKLYRQMKSHNRFIIVWLKA